MQQQRRKVSSLSDRSDNSEQAASGGEEESPGILSDDQVPDSPNESNESDETSKNFPWMRSVIAIINSFNFYCTHQNYCHPYCYKRHVRAASRLIKAVRKVRNKIEIEIFHFLTVSSGVARLLSVYESLHA
jgi:protein unc-80